MDEEEKARRVQELYREALDLAEQGKKEIFHYKNYYLILSKIIITFTK